MTFRDHLHSIANNRFVSVLLIFSTTACAGEATSSVDIPPPELAQFASMELDPANPASLKPFGERILHAGVVGNSNTEWLFSFQEKSDGYCVFAEVNSLARKLRQVASYVSCQVVSVQFADVNRDGMTDALYKMRVQSNRHDEWVEEEALFLTTSDGKAFCKSIHTPMFSPEIKSSAEAQHFFSC
jgi:hypothetical protein